MKKRWEEPRVAVQKFAANEYVAACITGTIQCVYPGDEFTKGDTGIYDDYNGKQTGWFRDAEGKEHGLCGYDATISFNGDKASGFEFIKGVLQPDRPIYEINGYLQEIGTYDVTWKSMDTGAGVVYSHKGRLVVTNVDTSRPNHS